MRSEIADRLAAVRRQVDEAARGCGRDPSSVTLIAVGKTFPAEVVNQAVEAGATEDALRLIAEGQAPTDEAAVARSLAWTITAVDG